MPGSSLELHGIRIFDVPSEGPALRTGRDATDLISAASEHGATIIAIPAERLADGFFDLRTLIAGEIAQKFVTYGRCLAIIGDISREIATSKSLSAFVAESNRGQDLWFVENLDDLANRIAEERRRTCL
jgi:hypothetical protein